MRTARFYQLQESKDAAAEANRRIKKLGIDRPPMAETQNPYGYVSTPLDGIWLRAPYPSQRLRPDATRFAESA
ncbi:MAG: hypothetical protein DME98_07890 [Verrucomicrobia bacterium]|nr:MAG: hypothetical protein DME98_07890 [Verrucomicrobiota bacterium]PYJ35510.1 MAG: hypothetical protein DME88_01835 [Verrucomicrobiota bacterium]